MPCCKLLTMGERGEKQACFNNMHLNCEVVLHIYLALLFSKDCSSLPGKSSVSATVPDVTFGSVLLPGTWSAAMYNLMQEADKTSGKL